MSAAWFPTGLTVADVKNGLTGLQAAIGPISKAAGERLANLPDDFSALEALEAAAADAGVPYANIVEMVTIGIAFIMANNQSAERGAQLPAFVGGAGARGSDPNLE
jgi:hypothetical protein